MGIESKRPRKVSDVRAQDFYIAGMILYVIVLDANDAGEFTLFQGFSMNALDKFALIRDICRLPAHVNELFRDRAQAARSRMYGQTGYSIVLVESEFFEHLKDHPGFVCVISNATTYAAVTAHFAQRKDKSWLHVTTVETVTDEPKLWDLDRRTIYDWTRNFIFEYASTRDKHPPKEADFRPFSEWEKLPAPLASRGHNILTPTETVFLSLGYTFDLPDERLGANEDDIFAKALVTAAEALDSTLTKLTGDNNRPPGFPAMILTVPSVFKQISRYKTKKTTSAVVRRAMRAITRQAQYIAFRATPKEMEELLSSDLSGAIFQLRAKELYLYTAAVTVAACSLCCPTLRLPPQLDRVRALLVGLATLSRKGNAAQRRRNQLALRIGETYRSLIPADLVQAIDGLAHKGVKLIGDVPLELLPVGGLPLSLRSSVSRLPTLPGNLLVRHSLMRAPLYVIPSDFHDVLIVRSFRPGDPLKELVQVSIGVVLKKGSKVKVRIVDVSTEEEFIEAFNSFDGTLAIFDGHGTQAAGDPEGTLHVGSLKINPFKFYGKIKVPPIIILSACETHTLEGFESSVAGAFLFMGARAVLGTFAPIEAMSAATLIARFLFRLDAFLPLLRGPMNWTEVVTGMLRMSYVTDILRKFEQIHGLPFFRLNKVQMIANMTINGDDPTWFDQVIRALAEETGKTEQQVRERWLDTCYFTETLRYVHLGSPEYIFVVPD